jgi:hypothetical protein
MFDDVHFTGTINLGNIVNALVFLVGAIGLYIRIKAELASHEQKTGKKIETSLRKRFQRRKVRGLPAPKDTGNNSDSNGNSP